MQQLPHHPTCLWCSDYCPQLWNTSELLLLQSWALFILGTLQMMPEGETVWLVISTDQTALYPQPVSAIHYISMSIIMYFHASIVKPSLLESFSDVTTTCPCDESMSPLCMRRLCYIKMNCGIAGSLNKSRRLRKINTNILFKNWHSLSLQKWTNDFSTKVLGLGLICDLTC